MITGSAYDKLKWVAQVLLPALGTLYFTVAQIWGLPAAEEVVGTIMAVDAFLGILLGISQTKYLDQKVGEGQLHVEEAGPGELGMRLELDETPEQLAGKDEVRFKVKRPDGGFKY